MASWPHHAILLAAILVTLGSACVAAASPPATAEPTATTAPAASTPDSPSSTSLATEPQDRIAIRVVDGRGEFYDRATGQRFVPRGNNYIRLADQQSTSGETIYYHSTFNVGLYDPALAEEVLRRMHEDGYNIVRVFLNGSCRAGCIGDPAGGLSEAYVANVADFLWKAKAQDIFVILTTDAEPAAPHYIGLLDTTWSEDFAGANTNVLRGGGILVGREFWQDLIEALLRQGAPLEAIFAYALRNELFFEANLPPLSHASGLVSAANGETYDMASADDRQRMLEENLILWIDQIRAAILERDPTALVTVGFFVPQTPNPARRGDPRLVITTPAIWDSQADFVDLHPYPGFELDLNQYAESFGMQGMQEKAILMGEFGAARSSYPAVSQAARALRDWQIESCDYGFDGWLLWTWDTEEQGGFFSGLTEEGQINRELAPVHRPDPCAPG